MKIMMMKSWFSDYLVNISSMLLSPHYAKRQLFPRCFCFSETEFVVLETDGWMLVWRGRTEREEGKDIKSYHRQSCLCWRYVVDIDLIDSLYVLPQKYNSQPIGVYTMNYWKGKTFNVGKRNTRTFFILSLDWNVWDANVTPSFCIGILVSRHV